MESIRRAITEQIRESCDLKQRILEDDRLMETIETVTQRCIEVYRTGHKTIVAGNGGSAADAQHIAAEFIGRFSFNRPSLPSIAITTDTSALTAIGNDYGFDNVFRRQIEGLGHKGDMFIAISTSGRSANIISALEECIKKGLVTVSLTGASEHNLERISDYCIRVPSTTTARIQEAHIMIGHIICSAVEDTLFSNDSKAPHSS